MNEDIQAIQQMLDNDRFNPIMMREILTHYQDHPAVIPCKIMADAKIIRSSFNEENQFHQNVSRLNYPPVECSRTERASLQGKPMFYASVFTSTYKDGAYPRVISALETTDVLRGYDKTGKVFTTQSAWKSNRDLYLIPFPFSKKYEKPCEEILYQRKFWDDEFSKHCPCDYIEFSEFISDLLATPAYSCLYDITATTIDYLLNESSIAEEFDGIMYPSVWGDGAGMNICLKTDVVDKYISFVAATVQMVLKEQGHATMFGIADSVLFPNGELKWKVTEIAFDMLQREYGIERIFNEDMVYIGNEPQR